MAVRTNRSVAKTKRVGVVGNNQVELNWKQPFSTTILESKVSQKFIDIIIRVAVEKHII